MIQVWSKRLLITVLIAVILGPVIVGGTAMVIILSLRIPGYGTGSLTSSEAILGSSTGALYYIYFSYYVGSPIALIAGLLVGMAWIFWRPPSLMIALAAFILATFIWLLIVGNPSSDFPIVSPLAATAAVGCWSRCYVSRI